jgi:hypothetical protein
MELIFWTVVIYAAIINIIIGEIRPMKWVYAVFLFVLFSMPSGAHVPLTPSPGTNLSSAVLIPNPEKTFAIYGTLHNPGETEYYRLTLSANQMLELQLSVPNPSFMPTLVVMGPGIEKKISRRIA